MFGSINFNLELSNYNPFRVWIDMIIFEFSLKNIASFEGHFSLSISLQRLCLSSIDIAILVLFNTMDSSQRFWLSFELALNCLTLGSSESTFDGVILSRAFKGISFLGSNLARPRKFPINKLPLDNKTIGCDLLALAMALAILNGPFVLIFRALNNGFPTILDKGLDHTGYNPVLLHRALGKEAIMAKWTVPMRSQARYTTLACRMLVEADHIRYHPNQIKLLKANRTLSLLLQERCDDLFLTTALFHHQNYNIISSPSSIIKDLSTNSSSF